MTDVSDIKFQEVEAMVRQYKEERDAFEQVEYEAKKLKAIMENTAKNVLAFLEQFKLTSHKTVYGTVVRNERWSWKTPKTDEERSAFREYLEGRGDFNTLWSVNSQTLNARCKEWLDEAVQNGDVDWTVPGISEPTCKTHLSFRKK